MTANTGGSAFPVIPPLNGVPALPHPSYPAPSNGLTARDWFAANAPLMIPTWFDCPKLAIEIAPAVDADKITDHDANKLFCIWRSDPVFDLAEERPELAEFVAQQEAHWTSAREAERRQHEHRYIAWRWRYADLMIEARQA